MPVQSKFYEMLPQNYGWVLFVGLDSIFVNTWMAMRVVQARKRLEVKYPIMYSLENGGDNEFNCIQRAHQNSLEAHPTFMFLLLVSGLQYPWCSVAAGSTYLLGRILYARGYTKEDPKKRQTGSMISHLGEIILLGGVVSFACHQLGWFDFH